MGRKKKIGGVGDVIAKVTETIGITPCDSCNERHYSLNRLFPFRKAKKMTPEQKEWFKGYLERQSTKLSNEDRLKLTEIYNDCFQSSLNDCTSCSGLYIKIIKDLTKLYNYEN